MVCKFATSTKAFSPSDLQALISSRDIKKTKKYLNLYFIKCLSPACFFYWDGENIKELDTKQLSHFLHKRLKIDIDDKVARTRTIFTAYDHVFTASEKENIIVGLINDPSKEQIVEEKAGYMLNMSKGFRFLGTNKIYDDFSKNTKKGVATIWEHIHEILCSGDEKTFNFVKQWICWVLSGEKLESSIYLQSKQGVGKSIILEFISKVIGESSLILDSPQPFFSTHNAELQGKSFIALEELEDATVTKKNLYNKMKQLITGKTMQIHEKFKTPYTTTNRMNFIYATNNFGLSIDDTERRLMMIYASDKMKGNVSYFNMLGKYCENDDVQHAFYCYCLEEKDNSFNHRHPPCSELKELIVGERLSTTHKFLKNYVLKNHKFTSESVKVSEIYEEYEEFCSDKKISSISIQKFGHSMNKDFKIISESKRISGNKCRVYNINREELFDIFEANSWIHEDEGIFRENKKPVNEDFGFLDDAEEKIEQLLSENDKLKKQIEELTAKLAQTEAKPEAKTETKPVETEAKTKNTKSKTKKPDIIINFSDGEDVSL